MDIQLVAILSSNCVVETIRHISLVDYSLRWAFAIDVNFMCTMIKARRYGNRQVDNLSSIYCWRWFWHQRWYRSRRLFLRVDTTQQPKNCWYCPHHQILYQRRWPGQRQVQLCLQRKMRTQLHHHRIMRSLRRRLESIRFPYIAIVWGDSREDGWSGTCACHDPKQSEIGMSWRLCTFHWSQQLHPVPDFSHLRNLQGKGLWGYWIWCKDHILR